MPRSTGVVVLALAVLPTYTFALDDEWGEDHVSFSIDGSPVLAGDAQGQGHVDFSIDGAGDEADRGQDHTHFCVDPANSYTIAAELLPGSREAEVCCGGVLGNDHTDFRIAIRADGAVEVNGRQAALCDPNEGCRVSLAWCPGTGAMVVHVADAKGLAFAAQYAMTGAPEEVRITAAEVRSLSVVPR